MSKIYINDSSYEQPLTLFDKQKIKDKIQALHRKLGYYIQLSLDTNYQSNLKGVFDLSCPLQNYVYGHQDEIESKNPYRTIIKSHIGQDGYASK